MAQKRTPDWPIRFITFAALILLLISIAWMQLAVIAIGAVLGLWLCKASRYKTPISEYFSYFLSVI